MRHAMTMTAALAAIALMVGSASAQNGAETAAPGTVTGSFALDGKAIALHGATARISHNPLVSKNDGYTVALTPAPLSFDPRPAETAGDRFDKAVTAGMTLEITVFDKGVLDCMLLIRDPSLGERRILKTGACPAGAVTVGPDRVEGTVMTSPDGKEETLSGHKVSYTLRFNARVVK
jgi:hypothetical protein